MSAIRMFSTFSEKHFASRNENSFSCYILVRVALVL